MIAGIVTRSAAAPDALGSYLNDRPAGLIPTTSDPLAVRIAYLESAMAALESDPHNAMHWALVLSLGRAGLSEELRQRLGKAFDTVNLAGITWDEPRLQGIALAIDTRIRIGGPIDDTLLDQKIHALAEQFAREHRVAFQFADGTIAASSLNKILEASARAAIGPIVSDGLDRLSTLILLIADGWPAAVPALRMICDAYTRHMSPENGAPIWRALVSLRAWR